MAGLFADARKLAKNYNTELSELQTMEDDLKKYKTEIEHTSQLLAAKEVLEVLEKIPVEEVNRDRRGIRVKALRDAGYDTLADLSAASVENLDSVYGISESQASDIKQIVDELIENAQKNVKIHLSTDQKSKESTALILAISKYRKSQSVFERSQKLLDENKEKILEEIEKMRPAQSRIRWLFAFRNTKESAQSAYNFLKTLREGPYGTEVQEILAERNTVNKLSEEDAWQDFSENSIRFTNVLENICPELFGTEKTNFGLPEELAREVQDQSYFPEGLLCELRRYQEWGVKYILHQERVLLGDEMGLGKTIQAIASMVSLRNTGGTHFLVVCPASVLENWCREIRKQSRLSVIKIHGAGRKQAVQQWVKEGGVAVTTYETTGYFELQSDFNFSMMIVDEAHYIKNPGAKRSENTCKLMRQAERLLLMTGTALENNVREMVTLISYIRPDIAASVSSMEAISSAPIFRRAIAPVYYRRKREDVLTELPELDENEEWCMLRPEEQEIYESSVLHKQYNEARRVSWNIDDLRLSSKASRMLELIEEAESEKRKVIIFSFFLDTIGKITKLLGDRCMRPITGSITPQMRQGILDEFESNPKKTVLCAQIQAGGTGLNIQSASVVIICEPQLKPSIENQAISRAYRMGQTRNVLVYRLLCVNTVDEKIMEMLGEKQAVFDAFADKSEAAKESIEIDNKTLGNIIQEEIDRINAEKQKRVS